MPPLPRPRPPHEVEVVVPEPAPYAETIASVLGSSTVYIDLFQNGDGPTYVALHSDEDIGVKAASTLPGTHVTLRHDGERNVAFNFKGVRYEFDPNRMFTQVGIEKTLRAQSDGRYSAEAHAIVASLARAVLERIQSGKPIVALHNNTNGQYSIESYLNDGSEASNTKYININPGSDPDDFFLTTSPQWFGELKALGYNVVLQASNPVDDGSLSVYAELNGISYVNVEAEKDRRESLEVQRQMLLALQDIL